ncbi:ABC transporter substrate-binding protein [Kribbella italica]|uniref:Iron complex transport system substrate-binding protein n=1 Tax=Kribbella italica TaxID=1540520 RepID=A0A7W9JGJ5_9ACTN|nr:ABC transporter substrate-binding protein [Kribbella italica]MBB5841420.1 iron complex transport system substrate-binding protein [Kribbella italica]
MASGGWSFEDDRGESVEVAERPRRVLAYGQAAQTLARLGVPVVGYFGSQHQADSGTAAVAGLDVPSVGAGDAVDQELVDSLQPDLVVGVTYAGEVYGVSEAVAGKLAEIAPILLIRIAGEPDLKDVIGRFHALAEALGGTAEDSEQQLSDALARLTSAADGVQVLAFSGGTPTDAYVANPAYWPTLRLLADAGVTFAPTSAKGGWEVVQWTDLGSSHPAGIYLYDQRPNSLGAEQLAEIPAWSELPAVAAGHVLAWNPEPPLTFEAAAASADTLAAAIAQQQTG